MPTTTKLVQQAVAAVSELSPETQDDIARLVLGLVGSELMPLTADDAAAIAEAEVEIGRGERVPDKTIQAFWRSRLHPQ